MRDPYSRARPSTARMKKVGLKAFFPQDEHPSPTGHRVLAESLLAN